MKFKLDENMPADFAVLLREQGHDADDVADEGLAIVDEARVRWKRPK